MRRHVCDGLVTRRFTLACAIAVGLLWTTTAFATCGDGTLESGEACDDGNVAAGDCCSDACAFESAGSACPDDANPCSLDVCDAAGICTHPTGGNAYCDDGDPCTINDVCGDGVCTGTVQAHLCIDAALCYSARSPAPTAKFEVQVDDQIAGTDFRERVDRPRSLCFPAATTGGPLLAPDIALVAYGVQGADLQSIGDWHIADQFGELDLETRDSNRLLMAGHTSLSASLAEPPLPGSTNHYSCRRAKLAAGSSPPRGVAITVTDARGVSEFRLGRPKRLCSPTNVTTPNSGTKHRRTHLLCYGIQRRGPASIPPLLGIQTADSLGTRTLNVLTARELCVPADAQRSPRPCLTSGDECGLPCCRQFPGQSPDCEFDPVVPAPRHRGCTGPTVLVDRTHQNFHQVTPESRRNPGRFWGFAKLLVRDGYVVRDNTVPWSELLPTTSAQIIVIANPQTFGSNQAISAADVAALVDWVEAGGSLMLSIDHPPSNGWVRCSMPSDSSAPARTRGASPSRAQTVA